MTEGNFLSFLWLYLAVLLVIPLFFAFMSTSIRNFSDWLRIAENVITANAGTIGKEGYSQFIGALWMPLALISINLKRFSNTVRRPSNIGSILGVSKRAIFVFFIFFAFDLAFKALLKLI